MGGCSKIRYGLALLKVNIYPLSKLLFIIIIFLKSVNLTSTLFLQVFLFTLLSLFILISSSGGLNIMESMMTSNVFHISAVLH